MRQGCILVLDVGKTNSKLSLWTWEGERLAATVRPNQDLAAPDYRALDATGTRAWLAEALRKFARDDIVAIVPIAHGAAAALVANGRLAAPPMSYEEPLAEDPAYENARGAFAATGSPRLPLGLNLGAQLHRLQHVCPQALQDSQALPYPQYWAWLLSGVAATEESSLGCHSDLWRPRAHEYSEWAVRSGWADRFAPLRRANEKLGTITPEWAAETGLPKDVAVYCGAHDSNAAFFGARSHEEVAGRDLTVISTGTWFVAMRAPSADAPPFELPEARDTLLNVGVDGALIPSARFMGGREVELLIGAEDTPMRTPEFARDVAPLHAQDVIESGVFIAPTFAAGVGPFPNARGRWVGEELQGAERRAAVGLYLALMTNASLDLIGTRDAIVVEGRFADDMTFMRALAALRPNCTIYAARSEDGLALGALRLVNPEVRPRTPLTAVAPFECDLGAYAKHWRELAEGSL